MDAAGHFLPRGEIGEIVVAGPQVMRGYFNDSTHNVSAFTHGWFRTGDQGYMDADGYLFITGRLKEMINRGGEKIAPREVDEVFLEHPAVGAVHALARQGPYAARLDPSSRDIPCSTPTSSFFPYAASVLIKRIGGYG
jgi:acyl-CoA synthetase (AMP-forming)/AMP-acid ligase II